MGHIHEHNLLTIVKTLNNNDNIKIYLLIIILLLLSLFNPSINILLTDLE